MQAGSQHAVVVGGGIIGACTAYFLKQAGWQVTLVDARTVGSGCSHGNCGFISPSHVLPLAEPGAIRRTIRAMARHQAPFYIKPRLDPDLWKWLMAFARRCNEKDMLAAGLARQALLESSMSLYRQLLAAEEIDCEWEARGNLFVYQTAQGMEHHAATARLLNERFKVSPQRIEADELSKMEPSIRPGSSAGAWFYPMDAHLRPDLLMKGLKTVLERMDVQIRENCRVTNFIAAGPRAGGIETGRGSIEADAIVLATGALTPEFRSQLGCRIPIQPGKGYSQTMPRPVRCPRIPMILQEHKVAVTPWASGYRLGSTMEFAGYDTSIHPRRLGLLKSGAALYLHEPFIEPVEETWYGWRPMTPSGLPILGASPALENVWIAAGHNMVGMSMGPGTGRLIAELVSGNKPHIDPAPYKPIPV